MYVMYLMFIRGSC